MAFSLIKFLFQSNVSIHLTYSPIQLWKWQLYLSQSMRNQWFGNMMQEDSNDDDQDTIKVEIRTRERERV
jgi:hypothetical protein